jgi:NAD(P)-dependent dehydrogenase (short-subunit alcohol dehydrogenase family)
MQAFDLSGKTTLITGAGSGIGKSISEVFARHGARVHMLEINEEAARQSMEQIRSAGGKAYLHLCDVSKQAEVLQVTGQIQKESGSIDILVNNAGVAHIGNAESTSEADLDRIYNINIKGVYNCLHACIPYMKKQGGGSILNVASVASVVGIADRFAYSMSKGAVLTMTLSVAKDYIEHHIRCNSIAPARVHTPFVDGFLQKNYPGKEKEMFEKLSQTQPIGRMGKPEEIAYLALYLCSDEAGFITGANYPIDGGFITLNT